MATAEEKEARQAARDVAKSSVVQGQQRLGAEVAKAASAFPVRRLRTSGDLSRYAIGGFLDDALPPIAMAAPATAAAASAKAKPRTAARKKAVATKPVVRALPARGVRTSTLVDATEARYINRGVGVRPTGPARR